MCDPSEVVIAVMTDRVYFDSRCALLETSLGGREEEEGEQRGRRGTRGNKQGAYQKPVKFLFLFLAQN